MAESARHLVEEVFGPRPVRQWVLSFPYPLRLPFASALGGDISGQVAKENADSPDDSGSESERGYLKRTAFAELCQPGSRKKKSQRE